MRKGFGSQYPLWIGILLIIAFFLFAARSAAATLLENFGSTSPGTMVQLATSHVPTEADFVYYKKVYPRVVRSEIADLTGEDPGPLRPWIFPMLQPSIALLPS